MSGAAVVWVIARAPIVCRSDSERSICSITCSMSSSHHQGKQCHQIGQHGHTHAHSHQLNDALNAPFWSVCTVSRGVLISPMKPWFTL